MQLEQAAKSVLEISKIIGVISRKCRCEIGSLVAENIEPAATLDELARRQALFRDIESYRDAKGELPWVNDVSAVSPALEAAEESALLTGEELVKIRLLLSLACKTREALVAARAEYPTFSILIRGLRDFSQEVRALSVIDDDGRLFDCASEKLSSLRLKTRELKDKIRRRCHALLSDASLASALREKVTTQRNGRYVFLVRQDAVSQFPGAVVDRSSSGNSVYMEHRALMSINNEYNASLGEEIAEETRILRELTAELLRRKKTIVEAENVLGSVDLFYALSQMTKDARWRTPELTEKVLFSFAAARHPLLGEKAVPIDIQCGSDFRVLVITGPNTGGKTVALKTAAVCIYLGWLGFPVPASEGSRLGDVGELFADIGDEQSIEQNLSTFSAHVKHVTEILDKVTPRSVVVLDELGAGTDPDEGAALGVALLDFLREKKALVLATTHHNPIKKYALSTDGVEAASVEFDAATLSPTYKILTGIPGRSNALLIAQKLGMKKEVIERAKSAISGREVSMEDIIGELHEKRAALEKESLSVETSRRKLAALEKDLETKIKAIEEKKDALIEKADKKAASIVKNAEDSARALIKNIKKAPGEPAARRELEKKRSHFHKIEHSAAAREEKKNSAKSDVGGERKLKPGDAVTVIGTNKDATVVEVRNGKALVQAGIAEIEVPLTKLKFSQKKESEPPLGRINISRPANVPSSVMVRGMTIDEAMPIVEQYLDRAYCAGYDVVTVIHGRGEGILRREVQALCKRLPYVAEHNLGGPSEGGYGVTVVKFKR